MEPISSLFANAVFGFAFVAFVFVLYMIGRHHTPHER
jgi:hypothetical protein